MPNQPSYCVFASPPHGLGEQITYQPSCKHHPLAHFMTQPLLQTGITQFSFLDKNLIFMSSAQLGFPYTHPTVKFLEVDVFTV